MNCHLTRSTIIRPRPLLPPPPRSQHQAQPALSALELIKQRALTKKLSEGQIAASRIEAQEKLFRRMSDSLHAAHKYFTELTTQINELKPDYSGTFVLLNVANFSGLVWKGDARSSINPSPRTDYKEAPLFDRLNVTFTLTSPGEMKLERDPMVADRTEKQLEETGFSYRKQNARNAQGHLTNTIFFFTCEIKVRLIFSCDEAVEKLRLDTTNLERFGKMSYEMDIDALNQGVFDQLTLAMMGEVKHPREADQAHCVRFMHDGEVAARPTRAVTQQAPLPPRAARQSSRNPLRRTNSPKSAQEGSAKCRALSSDQP